MRSQTEFGAFLRQYRVDNRFTQKRLQQKLGVSSGYISKLESGAIQEPDDSVLTKLADLTGMSVSGLREKCRLAVQTSSKLRMACGHSIWNAPLFIAASEGLVPNLQMSSFILGGPRDHVTAEDLEWIAPFSQRRKSSPDQSKRAPLSAVDVASLLQRGEVDIGSLPGNLVRTPRLEPILLCVGTVVDSASGCSLVCLPNFPEDDMSTNALGKALSKISAEKQIRVGAEEGTIAFEYLSQACAHGGLDRHAIVWNCKSAELKTQSFRELAKACEMETPGAELIGVVAWEPHASWLVGNSKKDREDLKTPALYFAPREGSGKESHVTYEIVIPRRLLGAPLNHKRELFTTLNQLMTGLAEAASRLNQIGEEHESFVRRLAEFYGIAGNKGRKASNALQDTQRMIGRVLYSVRWHVIPEMGIGPQV